MTAVAVTAITTSTPSVDPIVAQKARAILARRRQQTMSVGAETRLCAVIASLPRGVKVQDVAPMFGLTPTTLSRLRGQAFRGSSFPEQLRPALVRSFKPRTPVAQTPTA